jgi:glutamate synthase domain-containing protein 1
MSEEEKEAMVYKKYIQRKKIKRIKDSKKIRGSGGPNGTKKRGDGALGGHELFMQLIKKQFDDINTKEEMNKTKNLELMKKDDAEKHKEKVKKKREQEIKR